MKFISDVDERQCCAFLQWHSAVPIVKLIDQTLLFFLVSYAHALLFWPISIGAKWKWWLPCSLPGRKLTLSWTVTLLSSPRGWVLHCNWGDATLSALFPPSLGLLFAAWLVEELNPMWKAAAKAQRSLLNTEIPFDCFAHVQVQSWNLTVGDSVRTLQWAQFNSITWSKQPPWQHVIGWKTAWPTCQLWTCSAAPALNTVELSVFSLEHVGHSATRTFRVVSFCDFNSFVLGRKCPEDYKVVYKSLRKYFLSRVKSEKPRLQRCNPERKITIGLWSVT